MKKLVILLVVVLATGAILTGYAMSGSQAEPEVAVPAAGAEVFVADANGDLLKCNGKLAKVKAGGPPPVAAPFGGGQSSTAMDRSKKLHGFGCEKKNGKETGAVVEVELP